MMDVLRGKKKYLPLSASSGYELPYFRTGDTLTKNYIISKMVNNVAYKDYIPNNVNISRLSRKFLLSVRYLFIIFIQLIAYIDPELYKQLYSISKIKMASKTNNKWEDYVAEIKPELYKKLNDYVAIDTLGNSKNSKAFRLRKNGESTNIFEKLNHEDFGNRLINENNQGNIIHININRNNNIREIQNNNNDIEAD